MGSSETDQSIYLSSEELRARLEMLATRAGVDPAELPQADGGRALTISEVVTAAEVLNVSSDDLLLREPDAAPLFRNEGGAEAARQAQVEMESIMDDYLSFKSVVGS